MLLGQLKKIFGEDSVPRGVLEDREPFELATAALLLELARADFSESDCRGAGDPSSVAETVRARPTRRSTC